MSKKTVSRREFLKTAGLATAGVMVGGAALSEAAAATFASPQRHQLDTRLLLPTSWFTIPFFRKTTLTP